MKRSWFKQMLKKLRRFRRRRRIAPLAIIAAIFMIWIIQKTKSTTIRANLTVSTISVDIESSYPSDQITASSQSVGIDTAHIDGTQGTVTALSRDTTGAVLNIDMPVATRLQFDSPIPEQLFISYTLSKDTIPRSVTGYLEHVHPVIVNEEDTLAPTDDSGPIKFTRRITNGDEFNIVLTGRSQIKIPRLIVSAISINTSKNHEDDISSILNGRIQFLETQDSLVLEEEDDLELTLEEPTPLWISRKNDHFNIRFSGTVSKIQAGSPLMNSENNNRMPKRYQVIVHQIPNWAWTLIVALLPVVIAYLWPSEKS